MNSLKKNGKEKNTTAHTPPPPVTSSTDTLHRRTLHCRTTRPPKRHHHRSSPPKPFSSTTTSTITTTTLTTLTTNEMCTITETNDHRKPHHLHERIFFCFSSYLEVFLFSFEDFFYRSKSLFYRSIFTTFFLIFLQLSPLLTEYSITFARIWAAAAGMYVAATKTCWHWCRRWNILFYCLYINKTTITESFI